MDVHRVAVEHEVPCGDIAPDWIVAVLHPEAEAEAL